MHFTKQEIKELDRQALYGFIKAVLALLALAGLVQIFH